VSLVFVDGRNVQRSQWPNLTDDELVDRARAWAEHNGHELVIVFDGETGGLVGEERLDGRATLVGTGRESADDWLIREVPKHDGAWLVTSDRALREAAGAGTERLIGGGAFLRLIDTGS
jgi:predicted RNA-binding protein with PIN domain